MFLHKRNRNYNSYKFSYKSALTAFLSFRKNKKKQESNLQQVGVSDFCLWRVVLYFKGNAEVNRFL